MNKLNDATPDTVIQAIDDFNREYSNTENYRHNWLNNQVHGYAILYKNKKYPPKEILSRATNMERNDFSGGVGQGKANRILENLGFKIIGINKKEDYKSI